MSADDLLTAVRALIDLGGRGRARQAAARLPEDVEVADVLRAADGAQQLARALAAIRRDGDGEQDPHAVRSLYS